MHLDRAVDGRGRVALRRNIASIDSNSSTFGENCLVFVNFERIRQHLVFFCQLMAINFWRGGCTWTARSIDATALLRADSSACRVWAWRASSSSSFAPAPALATCGGFALGLCS